VTDDWEVTTDGNHIHVKADRGSISNISGTVTFTPDEPRGTRCCDELIPSTNLGHIGEAIVNRLRSKLTDPRILIRGDGFSLCVPVADELTKATQVVEELRSQYARKLVAV